MPTPLSPISVEKSLLAAILFGGAAEIVCELSENLFCDGKHRVIFQCVSDMLNSDQAVDLAGVTAWLMDKGLVSKAGGAKYLAEILENPVPADVNSAIQVVKKCAKARGVELACRKVLSFCGGESVDFDKLFDVAQEVLEQTIDGDSGSSVCVNELAEMAVERWEQLDVRPPSISTGISSLDRSFGGFYPTDLVVLAARPGMGKTALALNIARNVAGQGKGVLFFSLEMASDQLFNRLAAAEASVDVTKLRTGGLSSGEWERLTAAMDAISGLPLRIDDTSSMHYREIQRRIRYAVQRHNIRFVVIDYLQYLRGDGDNRAQRVGSISKGVKAVAKSLNIPVLLLSQLNRNLEARDDKHPRLADLKESGSIEEDADQVLFLYRDCYYNAEADQYTAEVEIAKNRFGSKGVRIDLSFIGWRSLFTDPGQIS